MTIATERPAPPRRPFTLIAPVFVAAAVFFVGGVFAETAQGVIWGAIVGVGLVGAFRLARIELTPFEQAAVVVGAVSATVLSTMVLPDLPQEVKPTLAIRFGLGWLPMAAAVSWVASRHSVRPSAAVNIGIAWVAAAVISIPAAQALNVLVPVNSLGPVDEPIFGGGDYAFIGLIVGFIGAAASFAIIEKLPSLFAGASALFLTVFAGASVGFSPKAFAEALDEVRETPQQLAS